MGFYYFAYGSNMLTTRLTARCPSAIAIGQAEASSFVMEFSKQSKDLSGKATLRNMAGENFRTTGILFEIDNAELSRLDRAEGAGLGYDRDDTFAVQLVENGEIIQAITYRATKTDTRLIPYDWYLALIVAGAHEHGMKSNYIAWLREIEFETDSVLKRQARKEAIEVIANHGIDDYRTLLQCT